MLDGRISFCSSNLLAFVSYAYYKIQRNVMLCQTGVKLLHAKHYLHMYATDFALYGVCPVCAIEHHLTCLIRHHRTLRLIFHSTPVVAT